MTQYMDTSNLTTSSAVLSHCACLVWRHSVLLVSLRWCWTALGLDMYYGPTLKVLCELDVWVTPTIRAGLQTIYSPMRCRCTGEYVNCDREASYDVER